MTIEIGSLNDSQRLAATWGSGPLLVLAGPGSGKTRVLTTRVARLLEESEDVSVLALTFTDKAAGEMRSRVESLLGRKGDRALLCTFHAFAASILRQHGSHVSISPDFSLVTTEEDRLAFLEDVVTDLASSGHTLPGDLRNVMTLLDRLFADGYSGQGESRTLRATPEWVPVLFQNYCSALTDAKRLDFGALLFMARKLLLEKPSVLRVVRLAWSHVCVDEFQDTNRAQYELLRLLAPETDANLFVVADDDQIIYQWNGASPERLAALQRDYSIQIVQLPQNYRCPPEIVALANRLIANNKSRAPRKLPLSAQKAASSRNPVRTLKFGTAEEEAAGVAADLKTRSVDAKDCVILARTARTLDLCVEALRTAGMSPFLGRRRNDFFSPSVRVVLHSLRCANDPHDRNLLRRLCNAWNDLVDTAIEPDAVVADAALCGGHFLRAWAGVASATATDAHGLLDRIRGNLVDHGKHLDLIDWFLQDGWKPWSEASGPELQDEVATWVSLHHDLTSESGWSDLGLNAYLQHLDLAPKTPIPAEGAIRCYTVHGAKGMEFKHVYLVGLAQEVFPTFQALKAGANSRELEEERRNCFVAITRAEETLTLTRADSYYGRSKRPSQFLAEMGL